MPTKVILPEAEMPTHWYNIVPDLPAPPPAVLHPGTHQPVGPDDLAPLFPMDLILQEVSQERFVEIPEEVREVYRKWRPSPLYRAHGLDKLIGGPARIYYKYEGVSPVGSHKAPPCPGVLQRRRACAHLHRDRCRSVGLGPGVRLRPLGSSASLHVGRLVRAEAIPQGDDRATAARSTLALRQHELRRQVVETDPDTTGAGIAISGPSRWPPPTGTPVLAGLGPEPRADAPDDHR